MVNNHSYFSAIGIFLSYSARNPSGNEERMSMSREETLFYLNTIGSFLTSEVNRAKSLLPLPVGLQIGGGEPFNNMDDLKAITSCALAHGMISEVTTNGAWATGKKTAHNILEDFVGLINPLTIFTSSALIDQYGIQMLQWLLSAARELQINTTILCGISPSVPFPREILSLEELNSRSAIIRTIPMNNESWPNNESHDIGASLPFTFRRCSELMGFFVFPGGDVYPCAGSYGFSEFKMGNLNADPVEIIADRVLENKMLSKLRNEGPGFIYNTCAHSTASDSLKECYIDSCDFHRHVLSNPALNNVWKEIEAEQI